MKSTTLFLPVLMAVLLSSIYLLPEAKEMAPSAVDMELPPRLGNWVFRPQSPGPEEIRQLAEDTEFSKAVCLSPRSGEYDFESGMIVPDRIDLSVVLSGHDLNNSIHRPERCMPSQGHLIGESSNVSIHLANGHRITAKRLLSVQSLPQNAEHTEYAKYECITYYFFVGHDALTQDHIERTLIDIKDRLLYGMDQRWAYVSASMWYGKVPWIKKEISLDEADSKLRQFLINFSTKQIDWDMIKE